jgi:hypothetical protein
MGDSGSMSRAFANLDGLMRLSGKEGIDIRPALLRVITDLFVQEPSHTREEVQQYAELSLRLLAVVDAQTRTSVIAKLTHFSGTPVWLLERAVALPAQAQAAVSADAAASGGDTVYTAAKASATRHARISEAAPAPRESPRAHHDIGQRFLRADPISRQELLLQLEEDEPTAEPAWFRVRKRMIDRLEAAAQEHEPREFARELQQSFGLSSRIAGEIVYDDFGEPLLVVGRAAGMDADVLLRILLLLNPAIGESVERVFSLYRLYQQIGLAAATPIMTSWREESRARPKARYQSVHAPDEASGRSGAWDGFRTATESQREQPARPAAEAPAKRHGTT